MPAKQASMVFEASPDGFLPPHSSPPLPPESRGIPFFASHKRRSSGPFRFRRSSSAKSPAPVPPPPQPSMAQSMPQPRPNPVDMAEDIIWFPRAYEDAWGGPELARPEIERARNFLSRMAVPAVEAGAHCYAAGDRVLDGKAAAATLGAIINNETNRTVPIIAWLIQTRIYNSRHASFVPDPLIQAVRFMLIKANVPGNAACKRTRSVLDFFFDPTLHRNSDIVPPGIEWVRYHYPAGRLRVCIIGGGPTGLASAISLAEKGRGRVEIHVWERRWIVTETGMIDYPPDARRRDQVVTLQDTVTSLLSPRTFEALFEGRPERVWPGSANIQIRKVEDRLLSRCQTDEFHGLIYLHAEGVTREELAAGKCGDFHILLGTDGAGSWVRQSYFRGYENERGRSYALGLTFDRGPKAGLPWSQPLNMFLTLGQTRYLLNASDYDGRGYLNMQLTEEEWHKMVGVDGQPIHFGSPGCLRRADGSLPPGFEPGRVFAPSEDRGSPLWRSIEDGLKLFGFKEDEVINVVRIPIVVQAVREGVQILPPEDSRGISRPHALVALAGDAAMTVHFWPGRGLNSGIKAGIALGDEICHALHGGRFAGLPLTAMQQYNDFIIKLQGREHDKRSIPILNQSGTPELLSWLLEQAPAVPEEVAVEWLVGAMTQLADRLERRDDWYFPHEANVEGQVRIILRQLHSLTLREMAVSFPWPTREMAGAEVLPARSMCPHEEKRRWLQQLWAMLSSEKPSTGGNSKDASSRGRELAPRNSTSNARFEAPRLRSKSPLPGRGRQTPLPATPPQANSPFLMPPPVHQSGGPNLAPPVVAVCPSQGSNRQPLCVPQSGRESRPPSPSPVLSPSPPSTPGSLRRSNATSHHGRSATLSPPRTPPALPAPDAIQLHGTPNPGRLVSPASIQNVRRFTNSRSLAVPAPAPVQMAPASAPGHPPSFSALHSGDFSQYQPQPQYFQQCQSQYQQAQYPQQYQVQYQAYLPYPATGDRLSDDWISNSGDERLSAWLQTSATTGTSAQDSASSVYSADSYSGISSVPSSSTSTGAVYSDMPQGSNGGNTCGSHNHCGLGDGGLTRLLSVKKPNERVLADAMSLALFRVSDD